VRIVTLRTPAARLLGLEATTGKAVDHADLARISPLVIPSGTYRFPKTARGSE
jgi:hypothetical protein